MAGNRRFQLAAALTLVAGFAVVGIVQNREVSEALPFVVVILLGVLVAQYVILFGTNTRDRNLNAAQREFLKGNFETAIAQLEEEHRTIEQRGETVPVKSLTLLGNTYRQLVDLEKSETILREAVRLAPNDPFPLYGLGRTLLCLGNYAEATEWMAKALEHGARKATRAEHVLALYYADPANGGLYDIARKASQVLGLEDFRAMIINFVLLRIHEGLSGNQHEQIELAQRVIRNTAKGIAYWQAEAERFSSTPYGQRLASDVAALESIIEAKP